MSNPAPIAPAFPLALDTSTSFLNYQVSIPAGSSESSQFLIGNNVSWVNPATLQTAYQNGTNINTTPQILGNMFNTNIGNYSTAQPSLFKTVNPNSIKTYSNILNNYANYTYHIVFSVARESVAYSVSSTSGIPSSDKIVIAESGVTAGFNITKFNITNTTSPGFKHQNMNLMKWSMTITEPFGLTLQDYILSAGQTLNIQNISRFPFFIELWFDGYDNDGNITPKIQGTYKAWRVMWLNSTLQTNQTGTIYELEGVSDNDLVNTNQISLTSSTLKLENNQTLQDVMTNLTNALNKDTQNADNNKNTTKYNIELPSDMQNWRISPQKGDDQKGLGTNGANIPINRGQDIGSFIMTAIGKCGTDIDNYLYGSSGNGPSVGTHGLARYIQIVPQMSISGYNTILNDYVRTVTYKVIPFYTPRCVKDPAQAELQGSLTNQTNKFSYLNNCPTPMLAKKYEYIYTGKNTEVIKFDIQVENFWQITLPSYLGNNTYGQATQGAVVDPQSQIFRDLKNYSSRYNLLTEITSTAAQALDSGIGSLISTTGVSSLLSSVSQLSNMSSSIQNLTNQFASALPSLSATPILPFSTGSYNALQSILNNVSSTISNSSTSLPFILSPSQVANQNKYLESLPPPANTSTDPLQVPFFVDPTPRIQQVTFNGLEQKSHPDTSTQNGSFPSSQGMFSQTIGNLYDNKFFLNITLEIRGDPWWIGMTNLEMNEYRFGNTGASYNYADFLQGENMFLLTFKTATNYDQNTGLMNLDAGSETFNGLYSVLEVENHFENGSFTQTLSAYKELFSQKIDKLLTPSVTTNTNL